MGRYVDPTQQLIVELYVRDIKESCRFFMAFGFELARDDGAFVELRWEDSFIYLDEKPDAPAGQHLAGNVRVMVSDVDRYWQLAQQLRAVVVRPIADRPYGLRDFTIAGPDGIGLRFASRLSNPAKG